MAAIARKVWSSVSLIKTDCKISWTNKDGKTYCFSNKGAKTDFLKAPEENIARTSLGNGCERLGLRSDCWPKEVNRRILKKIPTKSNVPKAVSV